MAPPDEVDVDANAVGNAADDAAIGTDGDHMAWEERLAWFQWRDESCTVVPACSSIV